MATRQGTVDFIIEQAGRAGRVTSRKMFGEHAVYCDGTLVALVCDDTLFVKPTAAGRAHLGTVTEAPPYPGAKPCFLIPADVWDDAALLSELVRVTAAALPMPAPARRAAKAPKQPG